LSTRPEGLAIDAFVDRHHPLHSYLRTEACWQAGCQPVANVAICKCLCTSSWGRQSCLQPPFRQLLGSCVALAPSGTVQLIRGHYTLAAASANDWQAGCQPNVTYFAECDAKVGRTPWSARGPLAPLFAQPGRPTGGSAADQGVRPTFGKVSDIGMPSCRNGPVAIKGHENLARTHCSPYHIDAAARRHAACCGRSLRRGFRPCPTFGKWLHFYVAHPVWNGRFGGIYRRLAAFTS